MIKFHPVSHLTTTGQLAPRDYRGKSRGRKGKDGEGRGRISGAKWADCLVNFDGSVVDPMCSSRSGILFERTVQFGSTRC